MLSEMPTLCGLALSAVTGRAASAGAGKRDTGGVARLLSGNVPEQAVGEREAEDVVGRGGEGEEELQRVRRRLCPASAPRATLTATDPPPAAAQVADLVLLLSTRAGRERMPARVAE